MNVEAFSTKKGVEFAAKFLRCHRTMMAIDESTTIKNPDAKRTKHICSLGEYAQYKRILTGSPVTKSPLDLYKQCEFLKKELLGHTSYYTFRTRYAKMKTANFGGTICTNSYRLSTPCRTIRKTKTFFLSCIKR